MLYRGIGRKIGSHFVELDDIQIRDRMKEEGGSFFIIRGKINVEHPLRRGIKFIAHAWGDMGDGTL